MTVGVPFGIPFDNSGGLAGCSIITTMVNGVVDAGFDFAGNVFKGSWRGVPDTLAEVETIGLRNRLIRWRQKAIADEPDADRSIALIRLGARPMAPS